MSALDLFRLDGRIALITGASSGIGAALARGLAEAGATVVLAARRVDRLEALAKQITDAGGRALSVALDVTRAESITAAFDAVERNVGPVDILINNAGIAEPQKFFSTTRESLDRIVATNFTGPWDLCQTMAQRLAAVKRPGSIVNISSVLGIGVGVGYASYASSKGALIQLTRSLALEFVPLGIRVNAIAPGWFVSEMNAEYFDSAQGKAHAARLPSRRTGELPELVGPVLMLVSNAGSFVNGVVLPVDGGHSIALV